MASGGQPLSGEQGSANRERQMDACKWCGEEGHEPAEVTLGCCGSTVERCNGPGVAEAAAEEVCGDCDKAADARWLAMVEEDSAAHWGGQ